MKLPVQPAFHDDETPLSFVSRLAAANGYASMASFLECTDTNALSIAGGDGEAMRLLADWSGIGVDPLARFAAKGKGDRANWRLGEATFSREYRRGKAHRFCRQCVHADLETGVGRPAARPYVRACWETKAIKQCPVHGCEIAEVKVDHGQDDFALFVRSNPDMFISLEPATEIGSSGLDTYLIGRMFGVEESPFLDELEAFIVVDFSKHFGRFMHRHRESASTDSDDLAESDAAAMGFDILKQGRECISQIVSEIIARKKPFSYEVRAVLDPIARWLRRNRENPSYSPLVEFFQDLAERNMPLGEDDLCIIPARKRYLHSVRSASLEYGLHDNRVIELLANAGILTASELSNGRASFDAELAKPILLAATETLGAREVEVALGLNEVRLREIMEAGFLRRVESACDGRRVYTRVRKDDLLDFQRRLFERAEMRTDLAGYMPIVMASRKCNCQVRELVEMILNGQLSGLGRKDDEMVFANLYIDWKEALEKRKLLAMDDIGSNLLTIEQTARALGTTKGKVYPLVASKLLPSVSKFNPTRRRDQLFVDPKSLDEFKRLYMSIAGMPISTAPERTSSQIAWNSLPSTPSSTQAGAPVGFIGNRTWRSSPSPKSAS